MHLMKEFGYILILKRVQDSDIVNLLSLFKINEILYFKNKTEVLFAGKIYSLWKSFNLTHFPQKGVTMSFSSFNFSCSSRLIFPVFLRRILLPWWMTVKYTNRQMQRYRFSLEIEELKNHFQKIVLLFSNVTTFKRWIKGWRLCHRCLFRTKKVWKQKVTIYPIGRSYLAMPLVAYIASQTTYDTGLPGSGGSPLLNSCEKSKKG